MRGNTISIELPLKRGKVSKTIPLYQYDYGQKLIITGAELPEYYEVHFSNEMHGDAVTSIGDSTGVLIPDALLATGENVYLWLYLHADSDDGETEFQGAIPVIKRAQVTDQTPTPAEQSVITQAIAALTAASAEATAAKEGAEAAQQHIENMGVASTTLPTGSDATVTKTVNSSGEVTLTFGLPRGVKGDRGDRGLQGETGNDGEDGEDGFSPVVSLTKSGKVTTFSVTDAEDTYSVEINDGEDGNPGQDATPDLITVDYSDLTFPVAAGTMCYHSGLLYKANQVIATSEEWTAAHWTQTTIEEEHLSLKTEINSVEENLQDILVHKEIGDTVTLTNTENVDSFYGGCTYTGFKTPSKSSGVITLISATTTETLPYVVHTLNAGTKKWIVGFKFKVTKLDPSLGNPENIRIHLGTTAYDIDTVSWGDWVYFYKVATLDLTRLRFALRNFAIAPSADQLKVEIKDIYIYDGTNVDTDMCDTITSQQGTNYQDGTVTYGETTEGYYPDTSLAEEGKAADSKAVGDAFNRVCINVKNYGVKGDGTTDDTDAINDLFTARSGDFYFPAGTYKITGTITLPADSTLYGDGDTSIINMASCDDLTACEFRGSDKVYPYILVSGDNSHVKSIKLTGNNTLQEKRHAGIALLDVDKCSVEDVTVYNINYDPTQDNDATVSGYGICVTRSTLVNIERCHVQQCGYECIGIVDDCNYCVVRDCYTQDGWRTCIQVHRGSCNTLIENNYMKQTHTKYDACFTVHGLTAQLIKNLRVLNNTMECTQNGAQPYNYNAPAQIMSYSEGLVFMGNIITGGKRALYIYSDSSDAKIIGNDMECNSSSDYGVYIASLNTIVVGNRLANDASTPTNTISNNPVISGNIGIS